jgi:hypothetical protein
VTLPRSVNVILSRPFDSLRSLKAGFDGEGSQAATLEILPLRFAQGQDDEA